MSYCIPGETSPFLIASANAGIDFKPSCSNLLRTLNCKTRIGILPGWVDCENIYLSFL